LPRRIKPILDGVNAGDQQDIARHGVTEELAVDVTVCDERKSDTHAGIRQLYSLESL